MGFIAKTIIGILLILLAFRIGLRIPAGSFPEFSSPTFGNEPAMAALPDSLPKPAYNFYQTVYGDSIPFINSAVMSGKARLRIGGITFPARFRFIHKTGYGYRHQIEITFWGIHIMTVDEVYRKGEARLDLPFGTVENEPKVNQGANLALWAEALYYPTAYVTESKVQWRPIDDKTAALLVDFGKEKQQIILRFAPENGLVKMMEAMRYKGAEDPQKTLWIIDAENWEKVNGITIPGKTAITWLDEGTPWAEFTMEEVKYNIPVTDELQLAEN